MLINDIKDYELTSTQELKIINLILKSIKVGRKFFFDKSGLSKKISSS